MYLIFDTETTGFARDFKAPHTDTDNWPRLVQLAWQLHDYDGKLINQKNILVKPDGFDIPFSAQQVHGISTERALAEGRDLKEVLEEFLVDVEKAKYNVGHNIEFDYNVVGCELVRMQMDDSIVSKDNIDTKDESTDFCAIPGGKGGKFKWPTLSELHEKLFGKRFEGAHDAAYDVDATARCFFGLLNHGVISPEEGIIPADVKYEAPELEESNFELNESQEADVAELLDTANVSLSGELENAEFAHLHCHTQFSVLQSTTDVNSLVNAAKNHGMSAIAMTDIGNMMGAFHFVRACDKEGIKGIVGIELNVCKNRTDKSHKDDGYRAVLLAKNKAGYHNLAKLSSAAHVEGFYYVPRIDKEILVQYKENVIATTGGLWGEVPNLILNVGEKQAEEAFIWWKQEFGDDFYAQLLRHGLEEEEVVNKTLLKFCEKHNVKYYAANDTYYTSQKDASAHDILLCVKDGEQVNRPKKYIGKKGREFRYGLPNEEFYIKSADEMKKLFADLPDAITNIQEIIDKTEAFTLGRDVLLPKFDIPEEFKDDADLEDGGKRGENNFLRHLTYEGAKERYGDITDEIKERLDFELSIIANTGYPGYFLIVEDFIREARNMGVSVGPGRGSAAGSAVAYCIGITNVDPIKYDLLFERFLNPDRVSMPDIDIDFDDEGRQKVIDYVIDKYGANQVAQIITYGTMAAKSSIRDAARAMELDLASADKLAKLVPDIKLGKLFGLDDKGLKEKLKNNADEIQKANDLKKISEGNNLEADVVNQARVIEGSVRNTGIHACGVIITPDDITNFVPVALAKDSDMYCTQFDNSVVEDAGLLKMDFLGLKTLTLIKHAVEFVKQRHGVELVPDDFPLDDEKTYELFQRGETVGIFQYESPGMQKYLRDLKPTVFADLIAMNALYRPGPLEYIPEFVDRKHGRKEIQYDLADMEEYLKETYGITVYQEQVMLLSQKLAGFTKGEADVLRKAMGKKQFAVLEKMKPKFIEQASANGHDPEILEKVWKDWEAFAAYAFNKSHSTCYAYVAFQTAYLKAHYPAEYMASVLSNNLNDIKQVSFFMEECKRMGIKVLGPHVNESLSPFSVNNEGNIRFGLGGVKGAGSAAVEMIVQERLKNGRFKNIYDFFARMDYKSINKKTFESLALAGALDGFQDIHRATLLESPNGSGSFLEVLVRHGQAVRNAEDAPPDLFGDSSAVEITNPPVPEIPAWNDIYALNKEKEVVGLYISGHPLDIYKYEIEHFTNSNTSDLKDLANMTKSTVEFGGIISMVEERIDKKGNPFGRFTIEDYAGNHDFMLFRDDYIKHRNTLIKGAFVIISAGVSENPWRPGFYDLRIQKIELLSDVLDKRCRQLILETRLTDLSDTLLFELKEILGEETGSCTLKFKVRDERNAVLNMTGSKQKFKITGEKLQKIEHIESVKMALRS